MKIHGIVSAQRDLKHVVFEFGGGGGGGCGQ